MSPLCGCFEAQRPKPQKAANAIRKVKYDGENRQGVSSFSRKPIHRCNRAQQYWIWGMKRQAS
jgi:hypothetical protein